MGRECTAEEGHKVKGPNFQNRKTCLTPPVFPSDIQHNFFTRCHLVVTYGFRHFPHLFDELNTNCGEELFANCDFPKVAFQNQDQRRSIPVPTLHAMCFSTHTPQETLVCFRDSV